MKLIRCEWLKNAPSIYVDYHDNEWGEPCFDDKYLFETLVLESFHTGLSWLIVLKKRENFSVAFDNFDAVKISNYSEEKISQLMNNDGIIRHKGKILATIENAKAYLRIKKEFGSFSNYIWSFTDKKVIVNNDDNFVNKNELSDRVSKDLKKRGFKFIGSVTTLSYLEAVGIVNNHETSCFKHPMNL